MKKQTTKRQAKQTKGIRHHANRLYHITPKFIHGMGIGAFVGIVVVLTLGPILPASALTINSSRDCDSNAVIPCGALSTAELEKDYNNSAYGGVKALYSHFKISSSQMAKIGQTAQAGHVYKNGEVRVGNTVVATGAVTAGREFISGSTKITAGGYTFYTRPPSVSFRVDSIPAFVVMEKGEFKFAILAACGNPVMATPVPKPKPAPEPKPEPKEKPTVTAAVVQKTSTQTPDSRPLPIVEAAAVETLPTTGPADVALVVCLAIIGGYIYHVTHRRIRRRRALKHGL